jgi:hypothetical protein
LNSGVPRRLPQESLVLLQNRFHLTFEIWKRFKCGLPLHRLPKALALHLPSLIRRENARKLSVRMLWI